MSSKNLKRSLAAVAAVAMLAGAVAAPLSNVDVVSAGQVLGETSFEYKALPWHTCESSPAKQNFEIKGGELHVMILTAQGADKEKWDLQVRHRNLNFKANHKYTISFKAKGKRAGMELCSKISNIKGDEEYCVLFGDKKEMGNGPHMGGQWGKALSLTTSYQEVSGTFTPTQDLEACEWAFHYAKGTQYEGNAQDGDEIWFDDMSIVCETCDDCDADPDNHYGAISRDYSGLKNNYISVNQLGYLPNAKKVAVLGDNAGDINYKASKISVTGGAAFKVVDKSGKAVFEGTGSSAIKDGDSGDTVVKLDFSEVTTPGTYHIESGEYKSFDFEIGNDVYNDKLTTNAINYFYHNRSGCDIEAAYITSEQGDKTKLAHKGGHKTDTATIQKEWKNEYASKDEATATYKCGTLTANGGWYDAGDHGKYVVNGGISVWTLANLYERTKINGSNKEKFEDGSGTVVVPEVGNKIPDILDECLYELEFMKQMKVTSADTVWGKKAEGMIYHKLHDHKWTGLATTPWNYEEEWGTVRIVKPPTFAATLNYAADAAQMARLLEPYDKAAAADWLKEAKDAYAAYEKAFYPADQSKTTHPDLKCECAAEEINKDSLYAPMWQAKGGGPYGDFDVDDDDYWAACELFISCSVLGDADASKYQTALEKYKAPYIVTTKVTGGENKGGSLTSFNWGNTASAGSLSLALHKDLLGANASKVEESILTAANAYIAKEEEQGYGIPYAYDGDPYNDPNNLDPSITISGYEWGSNSMVINNAIVMAYAYDQTGDVKYGSGVTGAMDYLLGTNPLSFSFITGYGSYHAARPHHRYWSEELDKSLPAAPEGVLSGGPNAGLQDPYVRALGFEPGKATNPSQRCYVDSIEAWSTNEVTINWNSPLAWVASFLADEGKNFGTGTKPPSTSTPPATQTTTPPSAETSNPPANAGEKLLGDVNCDGTVDLTDLSTLSIKLVDKKALTGQSKINADVTKDGEVSLTDLATIRQYLSKVITSFE